MLRPRVVAVWAAAFLAPFGRWLDAAALQGFVALTRPGPPAPRRRSSRPSATRCRSCLLGAALRRRRAWRAGARGSPSPSPSCLPGPRSPTAQLLKPLLAHPRPQEWLGKGQIAAASWPSGHATAAMTLALCAVLVGARALAPAGRGRSARLFAVGVGYAIARRSAGTSRAT